MTPPSGRALWDRPVAPIHGAMNDSILVLKRRTRRLAADTFGALARHLRVEARPAALDDALCCSDGARSLAYAQPCTPFGGLLFFADQSIAWGEAVGKVLDPKRAQAWAMALLEKFELLPAPSGDRDIRVAFELEATATEAMVFDGHERRRMKTKTDVTSRTTVNGIPVVGPRAKARMLFKDTESPVMLHVAMWESLLVHEERARLPEDQVARAVDDTLRQLYAGHPPAYRVRGQRLVYQADEFRGAPDLLAPEYLVEIETADARRVVRVPASR